MQRREEYESSVIGNIYIHKIMCTLLTISAQKHITCKYLNNAEITLLGKKRLILMVMRV